MLQLFLFWTAASFLLYCFYSTLFGLPPYGAYGSSLIYIETVAPCLPLAGIGMICLGPRDDN